MKKVAKLKTREQIAKKRSTIRLYGTKKDAENSAGRTRRRKPQN
jgi:hypothetical protein